MHEAIDEHERVPYLLSEEGATCLELREEETYSFLRLGFQFNLSNFLLFN